MLLDSFSQEGIVWSLTLDGVEFQVLPSLESRGIFDNSRTAVRVHGRVAATPNWPKQTVVPTHRGAPPSCSAMCKRSSGP